MTAGRWGGRRSREWKARFRPGSIRDDQRGAVAIETAFSLMLALSMCFWGFELCLLFYTQSVLSNAVRMGVRYAVVHGADSTQCSGPSSGCGDPGGANVISVVQGYAGNSLSSVSGMTVTVNYPDSSSAAPSRVIVSYRYPYVPLVSLPGTAPTLEGTAEGRIVY